MVKVALVTVVDETSSSNTNVVPVPPEFQNTEYWVIGVPPLDEPIRAGRSRVIDVLVDAVFLDGSVLGLCGTATVYVRLVLTVE